MNAVSIHRDNYPVIKRLTPSQLHTLVHALIDYSDGIVNTSDMEFGVELVFTYITSQNSRFSKRQSENAKRSHGKSAETASSFCQTRQNKKNKPNLPTVSDTVSDTVPVPKTDSVPEIVPVSDAVAESCMDAIQSEAAATAAASIDQQLSFVIELPTISGTAEPILQSELEEWSMLYPNIDVAQQLRSMRGWLLANPSRGKFRSDIRTFINSWLTREHNSSVPSPSAPLHSQNSSVPPADNIFLNIAREKGVIAP